MRRAVTMRAFGRPRVAVNGRRLRQLMTALLRHNKGNNDKDRDGSSSSSTNPANGQTEKPPVVIPEVLPPPSRGSQYASGDAFSSYDSNSGGGGRGGVFSSFSNGDMWRGRGAGSSLLVRIRLMLLSFSWACCVYLIISSSAKLLVRLDRWLGITAGLGYGYNAARMQAAVDDDEDDETSTEDLVEVGGMLQQDASSPASGAAPPGKGSQLGVDAASGSQLATAEANAAGGTAAQASQAVPLDPSRQAHLQALKQYGQQDARSVDIGAHATAAYFMIMSTLAFFFVVNQ